MSSGRTNAASAGGDLKTVAVSLDINSNDRFTYLTKSPEGYLLPTMVEKASTAIRSINVVPNSVFNIWSINVTQCSGDIIQLDTYNFLINGEGSIFH